MARRKKQASKPAPISLAAYARHRGCKPPNVTRAVQRGKLNKSVVRVNGKPKIRSADLADEEWAANSHGTRHPSTAPPEDAEPTEDLHSLNMSQVQREHEIEKTLERRVKRKQAELELEVARTKYVPTDEAQAALTDEAARVRTQLLAVPTQLKQRAPSTTAKQITLLKRLIRDALESLADDG